MRALVCVFSTMLVAFDLSFSPSVFQMDLKAKVSTRSGTRGLLSELLGLRHRAVLQRWSPRVVTLFCETGCPGAAGYWRPIWLSVRELWFKDKRQVPAFFAPCQLNVTQTGSLITRERPRPLIPNENDRFHRHMQIQGSSQVFILPENEPGVAVLLAQRSPYLGSQIYS